MSWPAFVEPASPAVGWKPRPKTDVLCRGTAALSERGYKFGRTAMITDELAYMSAAAIADHVRRRLLSPVEIVDACIARIERRNPSLNAFVFKGFEDARRAAKAAEQAVMSGATTGSLHGVPSAIKDLFDFKPGWPFTFGGVRAMKDCVAQWHCVFAERVEK